MDKLKAERIIQAGLDRSADFVEIFEEETRNASVSFRDRKVESATAGTDYGLGIRLVYGTEVLYAHTSNEDEGHIVKLIDNLARSRGVVFRNTSEPTVKLVGKVFENRHKIVKDPREIGQERKLDLIKLADHTARSFSDKIVQVNSRAGDVVSHVLICNSEGLWTEDTRTRCRFTVNVTAESGGEIFVASEAPGTMRGFEFFESLDIANYARMAAERAVLMLSRRLREGPARCPWSWATASAGVIFHEACGHLLETEAVRRKATPFAGKVGQTIAHQRRHRHRRRHHPERLGLHQRRRRGQPGPEDRAHQGRHPPDLHVRPGRRQGDRQRHHRQLAPRVLPVRARVPHAQHLHRPRQAHRGAR